MTKHELSKYFYLILEIKDIERKLEELNNKTIGAIKISDTPFGKTSTDLVSSQLELIEKYNIKLERKRIKAIEELLKIEEYISEIKDIETRLIFTKRYIELKKWEVIAIEMNMCERAVFKRHSDYLKGEKNV